MSDSTVTQNEINDLLSGAGGKPAAFSDAGLTKILTAMGNSLLTKMANDLADKTGIIFMPGDVGVEKLSGADFSSRLGDSVVALKSDFANLPGAADASRQLFVDPEFAKKLTELVNKEENADVDAMALNIVGEVLSKYGDDETAELGKSGKSPGLAAAPGESASVPKASVTLPQEVVVITYPFNGDGGDYYIREVLSVDCAAAMAGLLPNPAEKAAEAASAGGGALSADELNAMMGGAGGGIDIPMPDMSQFNAAPDSGTGMGINMGGMGGINIPNVQNVNFAPLGGAPSNGDAGNIGLIIDVFMEMTVELGRTKKQVKDILALGEGTIIELDKLAGEPVDILVNHKAIAKGEVVVIDENFGVRVTEILSPIERVNELR
jgi:flagellar motor switch protein FliN/FliY